MFECDFNLLDGFSFSFGVGFWFELIFGDA